MTSEELKQRPDDPEDMTPVYYVLDAEKQDGALIRIYVSSNKASHHFLGEKLE